jgi:ubiquinone/menaquinone biosynthesis C-methylase UbiE
MSSKEPTGYENEPDEIFTPLPAQLYPSLYHLEMSDFIDDGSFYFTKLQQHGCRNVLELGCGTGRIAEYLKRSGLYPVGIDISREMLNFAKTTRCAATAQMDVCQLGFCSCFDAVIIPYNTLNLLGSLEAIKQCLDETKTVLTGPRLLIAHLHTPSSAHLQNQHKRLFQFNLFDRPQGGKIVKESITCYLPETDSLTLEERYKIRLLSNTPGSSSKINYTQTFHLKTYKPDKWSEIITKSGFSIISKDSSFNNHSTPEETRSKLIVTAMQSNIGNSF